MTTTTTYGIEADHEWIEFEQLGRGYVVRFRTRDQLADKLRALGLTDTEADAVLRDVDRCRRMGALVK